MAGNWSPERIFLEYFEAEMTEIGRIPKAQMKLRILIKKTRCMISSPKCLLNPWLITFCTKWYFVLSEAIICLSLGLHLIPCVALSVFPCIQV